MSKVQRILQSYIDILVSILHKMKHCPNKTTFSTDRVLGGGGNRNNLIPVKYPVDFQNAHVT